MLEMLCFGLLIYMVVTLSELTVQQTGTCMQFRLKYVKTNKQKEVYIAITKSASSTSSGKKRKKKKKLS